MADGNIRNQYPQIEEVGEALNVGGYRVSEAFLDEVSFSVPVVAVSRIRPLMAGGIPGIWIYTDDVDGEQPAVEQRIGVKLEMEAGQGLGANFTVPRAAIEKALELLPSPIDS